MKKKTDKIKIGVIPNDELNRAFSSSSNALCSETPVSTGSYTVDDRSETTSLSPWGKSLRGLKDELEKSSKRDLIVDYGLGRKEKVVTEAEAVAKREFPKLLFKFVDINRTRDQFRKRLSDRLTDAYSKQKEHKQQDELLSDVHQFEKNTPALNYLSALFQVVVPSKTSGFPLFVLDRDFQNRDYNLLSSPAMKSLVRHIRSSPNEIEKMNIEEKRKDQEAHNIVLEQMPIHRFNMAVSEKSSASKVNPLVHPDAPKVWDYNTTAFTDKKKLNKLVKEMNTSPEKIAMAVSFLSRLWSLDSTQDIFTKTSIPQDMVGGENLAASIVNSPAHFAAAISSGMAVSTNHEKALSHFYDEVFKEGGVSFDDVINSSEKSAIICEYMFSEEALVWLLNFRKKLGLSDEIRENIKILIRDAIIFVKKFEELVNDGWKLYFAKVGWKKALCSRFGHPAGIPTKDIKPWHFFPGGHLVDSGFILFKEGRDLFRSKVIPFVGDGRKIGEFDNLEMHMSVSDDLSMNSIKNMARFLAMANEYWFNSYNYGMPRDNLYFAVGLTKLVSGEPKGNQDSILQNRGFSISRGPDARLFPTAMGRLEKIAFKYSSNTQVARLSGFGLITEKEIERSRRHLSTYIDVLGKKSQKLDSNKPKLVVDSFPRNCDEIDSNSEGFFYLLASPQRADAVSFYFMNPGSYLVRTGVGGTVSNFGVPRAIYEQIIRPSTPWLSFLDPVIGRLTGGTAFQDTENSSVIDLGFFKDRLPKFIPFRTRYSSVSDSVGFLVRNGVKSPFATALQDYLDTTGSKDKNPRELDLSLIERNIYSLSGSEFPTGIVSKRFETLGTPALITEYSSAPSLRNVAAYVLDCEMPNSTIIDSLSKVIASSNRVSKSSVERAFYFGKLSLRNFYSDIGKKHHVDRHIACNEEIEAIVNYLMETYK